MAPVHDRRLLSRSTVVRGGSPFCSRRMMTLMTEPRDAINTAAALIAFREEGKNFHEAPTMCTDICVLSITSVCFASCLSVLTRIPIAWGRVKQTVLNISAHHLQQHTVDICCKMIYQ